MKKLSIKLLSFLVSLFILSSCAKQATDAPTESVNMNNAEISDSGSLLQGLNDTPINSEQTSVAENVINDIFEYVEAMSPGWNLGNSLDATDGETSWGNPKITKELISTVKNSGYNSIRVPVTWQKYIDENGNISADYLNRVKEVVDWCVDENLYIMLNVHHDSWTWINTYDKDKSILEKFERIWKQIAETFKDYNLSLMFESVNEPYFDSGDEQTLLNEINDAFYKAVRESGGNNSHRPLVIPALYTSAETKNCSDLYSFIEKLNDPNIIATVHYYAPWAFSVNIGGSFKFDNSVASDIKAAFDICQNELVSKGVPVVVGEYGVLGTVEKGEYYKYIEYLHSLSVGKGITLIKWDNGSGLNRSSYQWRDEYEQELTVASAVSRCSYTEQDNIFITDEQENIVQHLYTNGNTLAEVRCGEKILISNSDYTLSDDTLTFSGDFLRQFADGDYGEKEILTLSFSNGADWHIKINYSSSPDYGTLKAKRNNIRIPVKFNGNIVTTLEAIDPETGDGVGPHNWTTYKEYDYAFIVNYNSGFITLTKNFTDEFSGDKVLFRIHYANDTADEYYVEIINGIAEGFPVEKEPVFEVADKNLDAVKSDDSEEFTGNKVLASIDVSSLNADAFKAEAEIEVNAGEETGLCLRLNDTDDQYFFLGSKEYNDWFGAYPHLGGILAEESGNYEGEKVKYESIKSLSVETWGKGKVKHMTVILFNGDAQVGKAEYSSETSEFILMSD